MKQALALLVSVAAAFVGIDRAVGHHAALSIAFGSISVMAVMIAFTFLWLWKVRATPLALGMSFSWAGAACVIGWWWVFHILHQPAAMADSIVLNFFLALYFVGAMLHFAVMRRSMGVSGTAFFAPVALGIALAAFVSLGG